MNKKHQMVVGIIGIVLIGGSFYAGTLHAQSAPATRSFGQGGTGAGNFRGGNRTGGAAGAGGFIAGSVIAKDDTSVTIKMPDGSTKIVLLASSTQVMKTTTGALSDLAIGTNVMVSGTANSDGSITGKQLQIRPAGSFDVQAR
jgi:hypothetical protein